jgi:hypothetical protein
VNTLRPVQIHRRRGTEITGNNLSTWHGQTITPRERFDIP